MINVVELFSMIPDSTKPKVRFHLHGETAPTCWGTWLISPVNGYWELGEYGPFPAKDASICEFRFQNIRDEDLRLITENGFHQAGEGLFAIRFG